MKKIALSLVMSFALLSSTAVVAQDVKVEKPKVEEKVCTAKAKEAKSCCSKNKEEKACAAKSEEKRALCSKNKAEKTCAEKSEKRGDCKKSNSNEIGEKVAKK